jgi:hypothetical protein
MNNIMQYTDLVGIARVDVFQNPETDTQKRTKQEQDHGWILTYSGRKFYPLSPHIDSIVIQDM